MRAVVFTTSSIGYWFYIDSGGAFVYSKTTDGGATWGAAVTVGSATTQVAYDVWFDQWTPGDSGTLIHTWFFDTTNDDVFYRTLDTNGDALGTQRTVFNGATAVAGRGTFVSGTKTRSGYLYCAYDIDAGAERGLHRSTDAGVTWSASLSTTFVEATLDEAMLFPASGTGDDDDCWAIYIDASAVQLSMKMWDSSAAAQVESTGFTFTPNGTDLTGQFGYSGTLRLSDGRLILAYTSAYDTATTKTAFLEVTWSTGSGNFSLTGFGYPNLVTNIDDHYYPAIFLDQTTNDVYLAYNGKRDGTEAIGTSTKVYYAQLVSGSGAWTTGDTAYMEGAAGVVAQVWAPLMGDRFYVGWRVGTTLVGNAVNSLTFSAAPQAAPRPIRTSLQAVNRAAYF